ncbi:MAG TPA: hypothetical protein VF188_16470 [Longimicrobiales bacterium]
MKALVGYALSGAALAAAGALLVGAMVSPAASAALRWAACVAYGVQLPAFAAMVATRNRGARFLLAWGGGILLRLAVVLGTAWWVARTAAYPPLPLLLGLVGFLLALLLLEPVFFRMGTRTQ